MASLGWMMYIGMAVAKMWDEDWTAYASLPDLYTPLRDKGDMTIWTNTSAKKCYNWKARNQKNWARWQVSVHRGLITS